MKTQSSETTLAASRTLAVHKDSHTILKHKPKIRIVHIVAPEIIKTDVENFRELVQRLTGKPLGKGTSGKGIKEEKNVASMQKKNGKKKTQYSAAILQKGENSNALLSFLGDVDGFMHGVNEFTPLSFRSSQINTFGEMHFVS